MEGNFSLGEQVAVLIFLLILLTYRFHYSSSDDYDSLLNENLRIKQSLLDTTVNLNLLQKRVVKGDERHNQQLEKKCKKYQEEIQTLSDALVSSGEFKIFELIRENEDFTLPKKFIVMARNEENAFTKVSDAIFENNTEGIKFVHEEYSLKEIQRDKTAILAVEKEGVL